MSPEALKYTKTHEWVAVEGDTATVGISAFAVEALTDLVFIELPEVGRTLAADESFCEIESVKAVSDIYAPVAGDIVEVNTPLADALETLGEDPFGGGWLVKIKIADPAPLDGLMDHAAYTKMCEEEAH
ncbi:MAG: glycine cleavage system protein GcvH [Planctomycetota bacterium]